MSQSQLRDDTQKWRAELVEFLDDHRRALPQKNQLSPLQQWHRRVTGGVLMQFLEFIGKPTALQTYPQLEDNPLAERVFLFISDEAGLHGTEELVDPDSDQVLLLLKEQWRAYLEDPNTTDDEEFKNHYEFWSVWHTNLPDNWDVEPLEEGHSYWVHEEGFALDDQAGRGAQHLWRWDGEELKLVEEMANSWVA